MKVLKVVLLTLFSIVALLLVISFFLKSTVHVSKSVEVKADPESVYAYLSDLKNMEQWSPWKEMDSTQKVEFEGQAGAVGAIMRWESKNYSVGKGSITRTENKEGKGFVNVMRMDGWDHETKDIWDIEPTSNGTKITWTIEADLGSKPWMKYMALMMNSGMSEIMPKGLENMKQKIETMPPPAAAVTDQELSQPINGYETTVKMTDMVNAVLVRRTVKIADIAKEYGSMMGELMGFIKKNGLQASGNPMAIYYSYDETSGMTEFEAIIPVDKEATPSGNVQYRTLDPIKVMAVTYTGDYTNMKPVYDAAMGLLEAKGVMGDAGPREIYIAGPPTEKDPAKWVTEIQFPVNN